MTENRHITVQREMYDATSGDYNQSPAMRFYISRKLGLLRPVVAAAFSGKPVKVLDIGCNNGEMLSRLDIPQSELYGIDLSPEAVKIAESRGIKASVGDISSGLPYKDDQFSIVIASEIIEHVVDTDHVLREILRVLMKGGIAMVTTPNLCSIRNRLRFLFGRYPRLMEYRISEDGAGHVRLYTIGVLKKQAMNNGFEVLKSAATNVLPTAVSLGLAFTAPIDRLLSRLFPGFGLDLIVILRKKSP